MKLRRFAVPLAVLPVVATVALARPIALDGRPSQARQIRTSAEIGEAIRACWEVPPGLRGVEQVAITARLSLRADGSVLGAPRITFSTLLPDTRARDLLARSVRDAVEACSPLPLAAGLGQTIAGRPFTIRFTYKGPRGQGA